MSRIDSDWSVIEGIDLSDCGYRGRVLDPMETDRWVEDRYFAGWCNWLDPAIHRLTQGASNSVLQFNVVDDGGAAALENVAMRPFLLLCGTSHWRNLEVEAQVRGLMATSIAASSHDEAAMDGLGRVGLVLRLQDGRRHYFCGFVNGTRLVIALRHDANWVVLNSVEFSVDAGRYHRLTARCLEDRFEVWVDGEQRLALHDDRPDWHGGPVGLYGNTPCRFRDVIVRSSPGEQAAVRAREAAMAAQVQQARAQTPQAVLRQRVAIPVESGCDLLLGGRPFPVGGVMPLGRDHVWMQWSANQRAGLVVFDLSGKLLWKRELGPASRRYVAAVDDIDLDGQVEMVVLGHDEVLVLDAATGATRWTTPFPTRCPFLGRRQTKALLRTSPRIWRMQGQDRPARIVLFEESGWGGHTIWCYDHELKHRWTHSHSGGRFGHSLTGYDVDGDGREEIVAGYYALNDEGQYLWTAADHERVFMGEHADQMAVDVFEPGGRPTVVSACGMGGLLFLDAATGGLRQQLRWVGHAQDVHTGNFRHDRPGREVWTWTDWGCHGIYMLFDGEGRLLHRFQPDPRVTYGWTIRWWSDGRDLLLLQGTPTTWGLWDSRGRRVVDFTATPGLPEQALPHPRGLPIKPEFVPVRFSGDSTDSLLLTVGSELLILAGEDARHG